MNIEVITMDAVPNYGSVLQAYATKRFLEKHGANVKIINFVREDIKYDRLVSTWAKGNIIKAMVIKPTIKRWEQVFGKFRNEKLEIKGDSFSSDKDFEKYPITSDAYCTGSDQVWNSVWNKGVIEPLYLSFVPRDKYKFALSASFGQSKLTKEEINKTQKFIDQYNRISVRENTGLSILEEQYHYENGIQLIDPTLLLNGDEWRSIAPICRISKPYILIYNLNRSKKFDNYAKNLSRITGLPLIRFCTRYDQFYRVGKSVFIPDVLEFVSLIDNARYVLTDSFHATAFSFNLGTEPICIYPESFSNRISSFLELTESTQMHVSSFSDFSIVNKFIDFDNVQRILKREREKAEQYITDVFSEISAI